jgi:NADPH-dependent ferric siderophore reductase
VFIDGGRFGFEFKRADAPAVTRSMTIARDDLKLKRLLVVHPGRQSYPLSEWAEAVAIGDLRERVEKLGRGAV